MSEGKGPEKTLSEKVEQATEGAVWFTLRLFRTISFLLFKPLRAHRLTEKSDTRLYILPLTFLTIGAFGYAIVVGVTGGNVWDIVWLTDDASKELYTQIENGLTITSVVVSALPGILTIVGLVWLFSRWLAPSLRFEEFTNTLLYVFSYQMCAFFGGTLIAASLEVPPDSYLIGFNTVYANETIRSLAEGLALALIITAIVWPVIILPHQTWRTNETSGIRSRISLTAGAVLVAVLIPASYTLASALIPSLTRTLFPVQEITVVGVTPYALISKGGPEVEFSANFVATNPTEHPSAFERSKVYARVLQSEYDSIEIAQSTLIGSRAFELKLADGTPARIVTLPSNQTVAFSAIFRADSWPSGFDAPTPLTALDLESFCGHISIRLVNGDNVEESCDVEVFWSEDDD